jgi:hypothetical protein
VILVLGPSPRVVLDVLADALKVIFISDDVLVVVALPDRSAGRATQGIDLSIRGAFESSDEGPQRSARSVREWLR